ncbi:MAG: cytochrome c biogenesis protein CcsA [Bdellovibrionales bacterium]|nr:cytochrome c biogenesis protein CcsA [Bdellovibrionales bacterium]
MKFLSFSLVVSIAVAFILYWIFLVVPDERTMGAVQRIFYFHVPSAFAAYLALTALFVAGLGYLATNNRAFDALQISAAEVSFLFASIMLFTGMIWGNAAWGKPFTFEPRLISSLLMWLLLFSLNVLRAFGDSSKLPTHTAALGILSALTVPVVVYSIKLLPQFQQLHPQVVQRGGLVDPLMRQGFFYSSLVIMALSVLLLWLRYRIARIEQSVQMLERQSVV